MKGSFVNVAENSTQNPLNSPNALCF